jgi:hypothetical protein
MRHSWPHEPDEFDLLRERSRQRARQMDNTFDLPHRLKAFARRWWPFTWHVISLALLIVGGVLALWLIAVGNGEIGR